MTGHSEHVLPIELLPDSAEVGSDGQLLIGGCDLADLAEQYGTPLFVYDEDQLRSRCREAVDAFGDGVAYATKAFLCRAMARLAHEEGMHLDVASGGELHVALSAGVPAERIVRHGNNKSDDELNRARSAGVGRIVVDSFDDFKAIVETPKEGMPESWGGGFLSAHWDGTTETELKIKELTKATIRCIPLDGEEEEGQCILTGKPSKRRVLFAKAY